MEQTVVKYSLQLSMLNFLYSKELLSKNEYEKIRNRLRIKYTKLMRKIKNQLTLSSKNGPAKKTDLSREKIACSGV